MITLSEGRHWRVDPETGCWVWIKYVAANGYARCGTGQAHREVWRQAGRPLERGIHLHHACRNRLCVNPDHMEVLAPSPHLKGHGRSRSRLTDEDILDIYRGYLRGEPQYEIAARLGVSRSTIAMIANGYNWVD